MLPFVIRAADWLIFFFNITVLISWTLLVTVGHLTMQYTTQ